MKKFILKILIALPIIYTAMTISTSFLSGAITGIVYMGIIRIIEELMEE